MAELSREIRTAGAVLLGLGSILGTGIFVSVGIAAGVAGPGVLAATLIAALLATCNALSSAELAAAHPVSGGAYEYGYRLLHPALGFTAGLAFVLAKGASAATAALGFAGYLLVLLGQDGGMAARVALAVGATAVVTLLVAGGIRRSNRANAVIVSLTLLALLVFVSAGIRRAVAGAPERFEPLVPADADGGVAALLHASALMFVAFAGYARIATLGEEVRDPRTTIPRSIVVTLGVSLLLYLAVAFVALGAVGAGAFAAAAREDAAPLAVIARSFGGDAVPWIVGAGAVTAMLGVLLNLVLGLSRVTLAMARRGDLPAGLARVDKRGSTPHRAVLAVGGAIAALTLVGDVRLAWSFSAFAVLVYYAITNLAALRLAGDLRRYPRGVALGGLFGCVAVAGFVEFRVLGVGALVLAVGLAGHGLARRRRRT